jgi:hypothetical protein
MQVRLPLRLSAHALDSHGSTPGALRHQEYYCGWEYHFESLSCDHAPAADVVTVGNAAQGREAL